MGVVQAIREEHAVQVVALVLRDAGLKPIHHPLARLSAWIAPGDASGLPARQLTVRPRHAEATLPAETVLVHRRELGVDEHCLGDRRGFGMAGVVVDAVDHNPPGHADLGCRQTPVKRL